MLEQFVNPVTSTEVTRLNPFREQFLGLIDWSQVSTKCANSRALGLPTPKELALIFRPMVKFIANVTNLDIDIGKEILRLPENSVSATGRTAAYEVGSYSLEGEDPRLWKACLNLANYWESKPGPSLVEAGLHNETFAKLVNKYVADSGNLIVLTFVVNEDSLLNSGALTPRVYIYNHCFNRRAIWDLTGEAKPLTRPSYATDCGADLAFNLLLNPYGIYRSYSGDWYCKITFGEYRLEVPLHVDTLTALADVNLLPRPATTISNVSKSSYDLVEMRGMNWALFGAYWDDYYPRWKFEAMDTRTALPTSFNSLMRELHVNSLNCSGSFAQEIIQRMGASNYWTPDCQAAIHKKYRVEYSKAILNCPRFQRSAMSLLKAYLSKEEWGRLSKLPFSLERLP